MMDFFHSTKALQFATSCLLSFSISFCCVFETAAQSDSEQNFKIESAVLQLVSMVELPATAGGPLSEILVEQGSLVTKDQVLARINNDEAAVKLDEALIELEIAKKQAESRVDIKFAMKSKQVALADYRRAEQSNRGYAGVVSDREMDRLKLLIEKSDAELEKIRFEKSIMEKQVLLKDAAARKIRFEVARHKVKAVIAGQIVELNKRQGEWVDVSETIMKLVQLDRLKVEDFLPASLANPDLVGSPATFTPATKSGSKADSVNGVVVYVSPSIDPLNSKATVRIEFENPDFELRPGMKGAVEIQIGGEKGKTEFRKSKFQWSKPKD